MTFSDKFTGPLFQLPATTPLPRCPYHTERTPATIRIEWTYQPYHYEHPDTWPARQTMVDHVCDAHYPMHKASLQAASSVEPVSVSRIDVT